MKFQILSPQIEDNEVDYIQCFEDQGIHYMSEEVHDWNIARNIWKFRLHTQVKTSLPCVKDLNKFWTLSILDT